MPQFAVSVTILVNAETKEDALWEVNNFFDWETCNTDIDFLRSNIDDVIAMPT